MALLRISESLTSNGEHEVAVTLADDGDSQTGIVRFRFGMSERDRERERWYFEDFPRFPADPAPQVAARAEAELLEVGRRLGRDLGRAFSVSSTEGGGNDLWGPLSERLAQTRVEIESQVPASEGLPWELIRDPGSDAPIALKAQSFVRVQASGPSDTMRISAPDHRIRVLLVVSRPGGAGDVPFRPVAEQLLYQAAAHGPAVGIDVLRPPTFAHLKDVLTEAAALNCPYNVVHFDGHGDYDTRGFLLFEQTGDPGNRQRVYGGELGEVLRKYEVRALVMNACRTAHSENSEQSSGSLAYEVARAGLPGVVAMRYGVNVETAEQFVAGFYSAIFAGHTVGGATRVARKRMYDRSTRLHAARTYSLQDWCVPVVYESQPVVLVAGVGDDAPPPSGATAIRQRAGLPIAREDVAGTLVGRDTTILALDRFYDEGKVALLTALPGGGKTSIAVTFGRWYQMTGGLREPGDGDANVLFTSFDRVDGFDSLLDSFGNQYHETLADMGISWEPLERTAKHQVVIDVCTSRQLLWIWDGVEATGGIPTKDVPAWDTSDQVVLRTLLRELASTRARVLLTSRRKETELLRPIPAASCIELPQMTVIEQMTLVAEIAARAGHPGIRIANWLPILYFANGHPRVITELVAAALQRGVSDLDGLRDFVSRIRESDSQDDNVSILSDTVSLASSLRYGLRETFAERDRPILAVLHLFRDTVQSSIIGLMGDGQGVTTVQQLTGATEAKSRQVLEAAAELGLVEGPGGGNYRMHPALPTLMTDLFVDVFGTRGSAAARDAMHSFIESVASMGTNLAHEIERGSAERLGNLLFIQENIRHARSLAQVNELGEAYDRCTQALATIYRYLGLQEQWQEAISEFAEATTDPDTGRPREGRGKGWISAAEHQIKAARNNRDWDTAQRLEQSVLDYSNERVADILDKDPKLLSDPQMQEILSHAAHLGTMGQIRREQGHADCLDWFQEALNLQRRMGNLQSQFDSIYNIGEAYRKVPRIRNLDTAEAHFLSCLDLVAPDEQLKICKTLGELGYIAWQHHLDISEAGGPAEEGRTFLLRSLRFYHAALSNVPAGALQDAATFHNQLGLVYQGLGDYRSSQEHLQQAHRLYRQADDPLGSGRALSNLAFGLLVQDRTGEEHTEEARLYIIEALRVLEPFDGRLHLVTSLRQALAYVDEELKGQA